MTEHADFCDDLPEPPAPAHGSYGPGVYTDMPAGVYHGDPCGGIPVLSASIAKILVAECPLAAWAAHPLLGNSARAVSAAMQRGTVLDTLLAGGEAAFADLPFAEFRKAEAKAARDAAIAEGKIPMRAGELDNWRRKADAISRRLAARGVDLSAYETQVTLIWHETATNGTQVLCKARLDFIRDLDVADLKTSEDLSDKGITNTILNFGYHVQESAYISALSKLMPADAGRHTFRFFFVEPTAPHATRIIDTAGMLRQFGRLQWQQAVDTWAQCLADRRWPDYPNATIDLPPYMAEKLLTAGGSPNVPF